MWVRHLQVITAAAEQIEVQGAPQNKSDPLPSEVIGVHASPVCPWAETVYMCLPH